MNKTITRYFATQSLYLLTLIVIFVLPLVIFFEFSTLELPKVQYAVLILLFATQYVLFREKDFHKKIEKAVIKDLTKEMGRLPSANVIHARCMQMTSFRSATIIICAVLILVAMIYYQKF